MLPGKENTLSDYLEMARRHVWLLVVPPIVGLFCALVYSSTKPDIYRSTMLIAVIPQRVPDEFVRSTVTLRIEERLNAIAVQVRSRTVLEPMINEFDLYPEDRERLPMEDVVQKMRDAIEVELEAPRQVREESSAFHVRFSYPDSVIAARVTQRIGSIFVDQNIRDRGALAEATDDFLESQLADARRRLEEQEKRLELFRERNGNALPTQLTSNMQAIQNAQLQIQANVEAIARGRDRKLMLERLYEDAASEPVPVAPPPTIESVDAVSEGSARHQLESARAALARLELRLTSEHPDILRVKRVIAELEPRAAAETEAGNDTGSPRSTSPEEIARHERLREMRVEIDSVDRLNKFRESEQLRLQAVVAEYQRRIEAVPGLESEWVALTRDYDTLQQAYRELLSKSEAAKMSLDLESRQIGENFRVLDPAGVPSSPVSPDRKRISGAGVAGGLALGLALIAFLEVRDASYRTEADVYEVLALPVLAAVPYVETAAERMDRVRRRVLVSALALVAAGGAGYAVWAMQLWEVLV